MDTYMEERCKKIIGQYRKRKWIGLLLLLAGCAYVLYLTLDVLDDESLQWVLGDLPFVLLYVSVYLVFFLIAVAAILIRQSGGAVINNVYSDECDPFLYEACLRRLRTVLYPDQMQCNLAAAQYQQGAFDEAFETLKGVRRQKLKGGYQPNYDTVLCALYFKRGMGQQAEAIERICRESLGKKKKDQRRLELLLCGNNLFRAQANQDYEAAFEFLQQQKMLRGKTVSRKIHQVTDSMWEARICLGLGDKKTAKLHLDFVVSQGGRLAVVEEARELLKEHF